MLCDKCRSELKECVGKGIISEEQLTAVCAHIGDPPSTAHAAEAPKAFNAVMVLYYTGALLILSAFGWFMGSQWEALGPSGIFAVSALYALLFALVGRYLAQAGYPVAGGLLITCCVGMTPLATYSLEAWSGIWPINPPGGYQVYYVWINGSWIVIELATMAAALIALRKVKFSFLVMPAAIALWFISMDITQIIFPGHHLTWELRSWVSVVSGLLFLAGGRIAERRSDGIDYPFWIYLAGILAFWGGLTSLPDKGELGKAVYCLINMGLIAASLYLNRKTFAVFGVMGVYGYLGHLAFSIFKDSPLFPIALAFFGVMIILTTVLFQKNFQRLHGMMRAA